MLAPHANLQFLPAVLILLRPFRVVFSVANNQNKSYQGLKRLATCTYFMISLSLIMRLISEIINDETHTVCCQRFRFPDLAISDGRRIYTHSLSGSRSHCGSWSCLHIERPLSGHHQQHGSRTLSAFIRVYRFQSRPLHDRIPRNS